MWRVPREFMEPESRLLACAARHPNGHRADFSCAEGFSFDSEGVIEAGAVVLPSDGGRNFYQLGFVELIAQPRKQRIGDFNWSFGHSVRIFQDKTLDIRKIRVRTIVRQTRNLLTCDSICSAHGRADVNSKRTSDQSCHTKLRQTFELLIDQLAAHL